MACKDGLLYLLATDYGPNASYCPLAILIVKLPETIKKGVAFCDAHVLLTVVHVRHMVFDSHMF